MTTTPLRPSRRARALVLLAATAGAWSVVAVLATFAVIGAHGAFRIACALVVEFGRFVGTV